MEHVYIMLFFLFFVSFAIFVFKLIKIQLSRVFTENYTDIKRRLPKPLYTWRFLSGYLSTKSIIPFRFKGILKIDVYSNMLIVSAMGKGLCIAYDQYVFKQKRELFINCLIIEDLPVQNKSTFFKGPIDFGKTSNLQIGLSEKNTNIIMNLVQSGKNYQA